MADTVEKLSIQIRLFDFSVSAGQIGMRFDCLKQIPRKNDINMPIVYDFRTNIWLKSYWRETDKLALSESI